MAISNTTTQIKYGGNGTTKIFAFSFKIFNASDIKVYKFFKTATKIGDPLVLSTDYSVSINADSEGGSVILSNAPLTTEYVLIEATFEGTQSVVIPTEGNFPEKQIENALDKLTLLINQTNQNFAKVIKLSKASDLSNLTLPNLSAGKILAANSTGDGLEFISLADSSVTALPDLAGNGNKVVSISSGETGFVASNKTWNSQDLVILNDDKTISKSDIGKLLLMSTNNNFTAYDIDASDVLVIGNISGSEITFAPAAGNTSDVLRIPSGHIVTLISDPENNKWRRICGDVLINNHAILAAKTDGSLIELLKMNSANVPVLASGVETSTDAAATTDKGLVNKKQLDASPKLIKRQKKIFTNTATGVAIFPYDDSKPQITEGNEFMLADEYIPIQEGNRITIHVKFNGGEVTNTANSMIAALFKDDNADCLDFAAIEAPSGLRMQTLSFSYDDVVPAAIDGEYAPIVYSVRGGLDGGTIRFNGSGGGRVGGGSLISSITIEEWKDPS